MASEIKEKVSFLEESLNRFIINSDKALYRLAQSVQSLSDEVRDFKDEMKDFKDEMKVFKDEMKDFKDEMKDFKDEMKVFKDEMKDFKDESQRFQKKLEANIKSNERMIKDMNLQWGNLANRLGTFAEDIAAPNVPRIARELFGEQEELLRAVRYRVRKPGDRKQVYEFDGVVETERKVFLLECKSNVRMDSIKSLPKLIDNFQACFPQYTDKELVTIFASMYIPDDVLKKLTKMGVYAMAMGDRNMELLNFEEIQQKKS